MIDSFENKDVSQISGEVLKNVQDLIIQNLTKSQNQNQNQQYSYENGILTINNVSYNLASTEGLQSLKEFFSSLDNNLLSDYLEDSSVQSALKTAGLLDSVKNMDISKISGEDLQKGVLENVQNLTKSQNQDQNQNQNIQEVGENILNRMVGLFNNAQKLKVVGSEKPATEKVKLAKFTDDLINVLNSKNLPKGFSKTVKDCFTDLCRIHKNKAAKDKRSPNIELEVADITERTATQAIRDFIVMVAQIILFPLVVGRAFGWDAMVTDSSSKQSAAVHAEGFQKLYNAQKKQAGAGKARQKQ